MAGIARMLPFPRCSSTDGPKGNSCCQITNLWRPSGCTPSEAKRVPAEAENTDNTDPQHTPCAFHFFLPFAVGDPSLKWVWGPVLSARGKRGFKTTAAAMSHSLWWAGTGPSGGSSPPSPACATPLQLLLPVLKCINWELGELSNLNLI